MQVFQERIAEQGVICRLAYDRRDRGNASLLCCSPATFTHDELEPGAAERPNDDRLQHADFLNGLDELIHRLLVEDRTGLSGIGRDGLQRKLTEVGALG